MPRAFNSPWTDSHLDRVAMPMGGIGAGMISLEGSGKLGQVSIHHRPELFHEPYAYAALCIRGDHHARHARLLEGPVPNWKVLHPWGPFHDDSGTGGRGRTYGLPRFAKASFDQRFPFGTATLTEPAWPIRATVTGWSPFTPPDADDSSLPVAAVEYTLTNTGDEAIDAVFSFHCRNLTHNDPRHREFRRDDFTPPTVGRMPQGFRMDAAGFADAPWAAGSFAVECDAERVAVDLGWFRGGWFDSQTMVWRDVMRGEPIERGPHDQGKPSPGASLYVPMQLPAGASRTIRLRLAWHVPLSSIACDPNATPDLPAEARYRPWYAARFASLDDIAAHWRDRYDDLRRRSLAFADAFFDTTLPPEVVEAVACNLAILKSPTVLRQHDGRLWAWEGCFDSCGCCHGSCTHVWNYAQALPHLFPSLERSLRETEFEVAQTHEGDTPGAGAGELPGAGHQSFRVSLPIQQPSHTGHAAADGQLGGIIKAYRDWRIAGDHAWLKRLWPHIKESLAFAIAQWDPDHTGLPTRPQHNTYDIEFHGPNGMTGSCYLAALAAAVAMGQAMGDVDPLWPDLLRRGKARVAAELFNGEYLIQRIERGDNVVGDTPEARALFEQEGPKYQYGDGCLSDGVIGEWFAAVAGLPPVLDAGITAAHLDAVFRHNFRTSLHDHANVQRPTYAMGDEAGLLLCSWPRGDKLALPFVYADEVWTGIEYQVASHLMRLGRVEEGLTIVRATRRRYDGATRNPFDEIECGHWYARALASYALLQGLTGIRYDAVERTLHVAPAITAPFRSFLCTDSGFAVVHVGDDDVRVDVRHGNIAVERIVRSGLDHA